MSNGQDIHEAPHTAMTRWTNAPRAGSGNSSNGFTIYRIAHRALRGRYPLVIALATVGAIAGAVIGFQRQKPGYRSEGLVRIAFKRAALSDEAEKLRQLVAFEEFLQLQEQVMTSRRVIERAMKTLPARRGDASSPDDQTPDERARGFAARLSVRHPVNSEHLSVTFTDTDADFAAAGVRAVIDAYLELRQSEAGIDDASDLRQHEEGRQAFQKELESLQSLEHEITRQFDPDEIGRLHQGKMQRSGRTVDELVNPGGALETANRDADGPISVNQIGVVDPLMREYLQQNRYLEAELQRLRVAGAMDANPRVILVKRQLDEQKRIMDKYAEDYRRFQLSSRNPLSPVANGAVDARHRLAELRLAELDRQITDLKTQGTFAGKVEVISAGVVPLLPYQDGRFRSAAGGALAGAGLPVSLLLLWGLWNRRLRSADDLTYDAGADAGASAAQLLGVLPQLPRGRITAAQEAVWTFCVHQIRVMLQARNGHADSSAYLVTSVSPSEGKTQLTLALGRSFAQSGFKTLAIDCDLIAQGLTQRLGIDSEKDLITSLAQASLDGCIHLADSTGLAVLPVRGGVEVDGLSSASLRRLLDQARRQFDVILIDSGSVLSSIEAALLAPEVDGVILTLTKGQQQPQIEKTVRHLAAIGGKIVGTVFNRAKFPNVRTSVPTSTPLLSSSLNAL